MAYVITDLQGLEEAAVGAEAQPGGLSVGEGATLAESGACKCVLGCIGSLFFYSSCVDVCCKACYTDLDAFYKCSHYDSRY